MKIHEIITEAPAGMLGQIGRRLGAAALGAVGARGFAGQLSGTADAKAWANRYYDEFSKFLGRTGTRLAAATTQDLRDFFQTSNLPDDHIPDSNIPANEKMVNDILQRTANDYFRGRSTGKRVSAAGSQSAATQSGNIGATPADIRQQKQQTAAAAAQQQMATSPAPTTTNTASLEQDKVYVGSDGKSYKWLGAQWQNMETGKSVSAKAAELSDPQPETPEQKRIRLQKKATKTIARTAKAVKTAPSVNPKTPPVAV
jgi:hypothetical protein